MRSGYLSIRRNNTLVTHPGVQTSTRALELCCFALIVAQAIYLAASFWQGSWLIADDETRIPTDFVNVWAAGKMALAGNAVSAYDWPAHKAAEIAALGHPFSGYFGWHYPPTFLFAAAALALLPYIAAHLLWSFGTFAAYLTAIRTIVGEREGWMLAAAFPAVLCNFIVGQNGFVSAALFGTGLLFIERRPVLAGLMIGFLSFKPHLGVLIPLALIAGGHWRALLSAGVVSVVLAILSAAVFGSATWHAFYLNIGHTSEAFLSNGWADWSKLQTVFGLARTLGGDEFLAWSAQIAMTLTAAIVVVCVWRGGLGYEIKAMTLALAALIATPYLYTYDLMLLAVPLAFLMRRALADGFLAFELAGIGIACLAVLIFPFVTLPVGLVGILVVALLALRRAQWERGVPVI